VGYPFLLGQMVHRKAFVVRGPALLFDHNEEILTTIHDWLVLLQLFPSLRTMNQPAAILQPDFSPSVIRPGCRSWPSTRSFITNEPSGNSTSKSMFSLLESLLL
jgi:hypothetical protein